MYGRNQQYCKAIILQFKKKERERQKDRVQSLLHMVIVSIHGDPPGVRHSARATGGQNQTHSCPAWKYSLMVEQ